MEVVWMMADAPSMTESEFSVEGGAKITRYECSSEEGTFPMLAGVYKAVLVLSGCYLSFLTRNVNPSFAESKSIMMGMYLIAILGGLTLIITGMGLEPAPRTLMGALGTVVSCVSATLAIFVPKVSKAKLSHGELFSDASGASQGTSAGTSIGTSSNDNDNAEELKGALEDLKSANEEIARLQAKLEATA